MTFNTRKNKKNIIHYKRLCQIFILHAAVEKEDQILYSGNDYV